MRSAPLRQVAAVIEERMRWVAVQTPYVSDAVRYAWEAAVAAQSDVEPTWLHGDLHALNVLVDNGVLSGVIDWGDVTAGDRATDLASLWMLFADPTARQRVVGCLRAGKRCDLPACEGAGGCVRHNTARYTAGRQSAPRLHRGAHVAANHRGGLIRTGDETTAKLLELRPFPDRREVAVV